MSSEDPANSKVLYSGKIFKLLEKSFTTPDGKPFTRQILTHPGAVVIIPVKADGKLIMVRQFRQAVNQNFLEFPAGTLEIGEEPLACAKREIIEEAGQAAKVWHELGVIFPAPGFCTERQVLFVAQELTPQYAACDEDEDISLEELSVAQIKAAIVSGDLSDAKSIAALYMAQLRGLLPA